MLQHECAGLCSMQQDHNGTNHNGLAAHTPHALTLEHKDANSTIDTYSSGVGLLAELIEGFQVVADVGNALARQRWSSDK